MQHRFLTAAALALALPLSLAVAAPATAAAPVAVTVKGHILSPTGKPVAGVRVAVRAKGQAGASLGAGVAFTGSTGRYELQVPPPDENDGLDVAKSYVLRVTDPGGGEWAPASETFPAAGNSYHRDATVHHGAKLSGRAYDSAGRTVRAGLTVWANGTSTTTRSDGSYHFTALPAGRTSVQIESPSSNGGARYYSSATSHGVLDGADATELDLRYGSRTTGRSIRFPLVAKITGQVIIDGVKQVGEGVDSAEVELLDAKGRRIAFRPAGPTFAFRDLAAGTYHLHFHDGSGDDPSGIVPEYYEDAATLADATPVVLRAGGAATRLRPELVTR